MSQLPLSAFQTYNPANAASIVAGPLALYAVPVDSLLPTQMNEGFTEVDTKAAAFDLLTPSELRADLLGDIEPVVIGPGGQLYLTDGHHTFTALEDSIYGASNPTVYVNVIANYSNLTEAEFFATMQANNLLLPLNDGVPQTVNDATGSPIPRSLTGLTSDVYRGLEYSILKNKSSKLFKSTSNITGAVGASTPGLDKMTGFYSDFLEAAAYQDANGGLGLPYLSPADIALATQWNLTANSTTTLPNVAGTVTAAQLPGFILSANIVNAGGISNATLANGAMDGNGTFTGITEINAGTLANPIMIGTPNIGFILQLGNDKGFTVTLNGTNTYTGGTSLLAGTLIIASDSSLGAEPTSTTVNPNAVLSSVQADNGIIFNSLTEGNATLEIGTTAGGGTATFSTDRPIAVGGEEATINLNGYEVTLTGQLVSLGTNGVGIGNSTGYSDLTIDDNSSNDGILYLSTPSPDFWGNLIIGNVNKPTVNVTSDLAMGNTLANDPNDPVGEVELNGGTLQAGANFSATDRNLFLGGSSSFDVNGFTTSWGSLTDVQRTLTIENSSTANAGAVTFASLAIGSTATLAVDAGTGTAGGKGTTVTFTNGITRNGDTNANATANATLFIDPSSGSTLGSSAANGVRVFSSGASTTLVHGIAPVWIITDSGGAASTNPYNFVTYGSNGYVAATYTDTGSGSTGGIRTATSSSIVDQTGSATLAANAAAYALNINNGATITANGFSITLGDGTDPAGLILEGTTTIAGGTLAFRGSEAVIDVKATNTISSAVTGTDGLTLSGSGTLVLSGTASGLSGPINIDSGTLQLNTANYFVAGTTLWLSNVKTKPSNAILAIDANETLAALNSDGNNSSIAISTGDTLTIGDTNNFSSTLSSTITATGTGSLVKAGSGLLDISGASVSFATGTVTVAGGQLRIGNGVFGASATTAIIVDAGTELQYSGNGGSVFNDPVSGAGVFHLVAGTVQLTSTSNSYSGGTVVETGATLDITTANLPSTDENITDAGGLILFDQNTTGTFSGVISDGQEMGSGPMESGSLDKDDSSGDNSGNVTIASVQAYSGATYIEAGTLTLGAVNTVADSSGVTLGRVGGGATAILALDANNTIAALSSDASNTTTVQLNGYILTLAPTLASSSAFGGSIVDGSASGGSIVKTGIGTATLSGVDTFTGGVTIDAGTLELGEAQAAGSGAITFGSGANATLKIDLGDAPTNQINGFAIGDTIDLLGVGTETTLRYVGGVLTVSGGSQSAQLDMAEPPTHEGFVLASDGSGGTLVTLTADRGPTVTSTTPSLVENNQTTIIGTVQAGLADDTLTLTQTGGTGTVSLQLVNGVEEVIYTAPATVTASLLDTVSYKIADEYNDVVTESNTVPVAPATNTVYVGAAGGSLSVGNGSSAVDGRAGNERIQAGNGADAVFAGSSDTISLGNGNDTVLGGSYDTIQAGNGTDNISAGANSSVTAGNNPDTVTVGDNSTVLVGNGADSVTAGANANITLGNGNDTLTVGNNGTLRAGNGNDIVTAGSGSTISLGNGNNTVNAGANDIISVGNGQNQLVAAPGDMWTIGTGSNDIAFNTGFGNDTISNFNTSKDVLQFSPSLLLNYAAAMADTRQVGANTVITVDANDTITLNGVTASHLTQSNFRFT